MELSFEELREKEVINIFNGKKLGHIIDMIFDMSTSRIIGIVVPGDKKLFKKSEDFFISVRQIKRIGDDVILVAMNGLSYFNGINKSKNDEYSSYFKKNKFKEKSSLIHKKENSFVRYRRINNNKLN